MSAIVLKSILESLQSTYGAEAFSAVVTQMPYFPPPSSAKPSAAPSAEPSDPSVASSAEPAAKRRGPKKLADMTVEERSAWDAKKAVKKAAKAATAEQPVPVPVPAAEVETEAEDARSQPSASDSSSKRGHRTWTPEQKAAASERAKARHAAKKGSEAAPEAVDLTSGVPEGWAELTEGKPTTKPVKEKKLPKPSAKAKKLDLSLYHIELEGVSYLTNDRGDLIAAEDFEWVGRLVDGSLDKSVAEPTDLDGVGMRA